MILFVPKETHLGETRCALTPDSARNILQLGIEVQIESHAGDASLYSDQDYQEVGVSVIQDRSKALSNADIVLRVRPPALSEVVQHKSGALHLSFLDPFNQGTLINAFAKAGVTALSLEMLPRTTIAQKMDALSSQANLAGYYAVLLGALTQTKVIPMMTTPSGTLAPARVFVIGVGVAGLQAIATAKRLGARVTAFDPRPETEEQVKSLGAKFLKIDLGETGQTEDGYAKELKPEQIAQQQAAQAKACAQSDIVITTAKLFGRKPPRLIDANTIASMAPGSVIVDLAAEDGGNVEGVIAGESVISANGVHLVGKAPLECLLPTHASQMYANNLANFLSHFWDLESKSFQLDLTENHLKGCVITHAGYIVHEHFKNA